MRQPEESNRKLRSATPRVEIPEASRVVSETPGFDAGTEVSGTRSVSSTTNWCRCRRATTRWLCGAKRQLAVADIAVIT
jgi:hypothetical protein